MQAVHEHLMLKRKAAYEGNKGGPRVLIAGPTDAGKSTLAKSLLRNILLTDTMENDEELQQVIFADLDIGQGEISLPGVIAASILDKTCLEGSEDGNINIKESLKFYVGHTSLEECATLFQYYVKELAYKVSKRTENNRSCKVLSIVDFESRND